VQIFEVLTYRILEPDIFIHRVVYASNGLIVADNLSLISIHFVPSWLKSDSMYVSVRRTLLVVKLCHMMSNIKLGSPVSLSNCLTQKLFARDNSKVRFVKRTDIALLLE
jgi:hypothetical protein